MDKQSIVFDKSREEREMRGAQLFRMDKVAKKNIGGKTEFEIRDGGSRHRVFKRDGKTCCSCFEFLMYRKHDYLCEHFFAVREYVQKEIETTSEMTRTAEKTAEVRVAEILNRTDPGWSKSVVRREKVGTLPTLFVMKVEIGGIAREGIGFSEPEALAAAAEKFGLFRTGGYSAV